MLILEEEKKLHHPSFKIMQWNFLPHKGITWGVKKRSFFLRTLIVLILDMAGRRMRFTHSGKSSLFWSYLNYFIWKEWMKRKLIDFRFWSTIVEWLFDLPRYLLFHFYPLCFLEFNNILFLSSEINFFFIWYVTK